MKLAKNILLKLLAPLLDFINPEILTPKPYDFCFMHHVYYSFMKQGMEVKTQLYYCDIRVCLEIIDIISGEITCSYTNKDLEKVKRSNIKKLKKEFFEKIVRVV